MVPQRSTEFIWITDGFFGCDACTGDQSIAETQIVLNGPDTVAVRMEAEVCHTCQRRCGLLDDLNHLLDIIDWPSEVVDSFSDKGSGLDVYVVDDPHEGLMPWSTYRLLERKRSTTSPEDVREIPEAAVLALPQSHEMWQVAERPLDWIRTQNGQLVLSYLTVITDEDGLVVHSILNPVRRLSGPKLLSGLHEAMMHAEVLTHPQRPRTIANADANVLQSILPALNRVGIGGVVRSTPLADEALSAAISAIRLDEHPPLLEDVSSRALSQFTEAARAYFALVPWERLVGNNYIAVQLDGGPWRYLNIIGHLHEEFGLNVFDSWLQLCRFLHNQPDEHEFDQPDAIFRPIAAAGHLEALSLDPLEEFNPDDADRLIQEGLRPISIPHEHWHGFPSIKRIDANGYQQPERSLAFFQTLLQGLTNAIKNRKQASIRSIQKTLKISDRKVRFIYPATGIEHFGQDRRTFRVTLINRTPDAIDEDEITPLPEEIELSHIPSYVNVSYIAWILADATDDLFAITGLRQGAYYVWRDGPDVLPSPPLALLMQRSALFAEFYFATYEMRIDRLPRNQTTQTPTIRFIAALPDETD